MFVDVLREKIVTKGQKPGEPAKRSGQYIPVGPRGGQGGVEVTIVKDKSLPPTPKSGQVWEIVDPTKNKSGRG